MIPLNYPFSTDFLPSVPFQHLGWLHSLEGGQMCA